MHPSQPRTHDSRTESETQDLAIDAEDVHVTYDDGTEAVSGVDLTVQAGEFIGFLGPNGAGKTTTIKTLVTLLQPTRGTVRINGYDTAERPQAVCKSIGYMAQETSIDEELTARENVQFACELYGVPPAERDDRVTELLDLVNLADVADKRAETFSGGMKKRLDAVTVLVHQPPVVFLDEPTTGLDPEARRQFWSYLKSINERGTTVFLTTQYLDEIDRLCDRLAVIQDGEIIAAAAPNTLKTVVGGDILDITIQGPSGAADRAEQVARRLDALNGATVEATEDGLSITSGQAHKVVNDLLIAFYDAGISVSGLDVRSPTLDDVFIELTGKAPSESGRSTSHTPDIDPEVAR